MRGPFLRPSRKLRNKAPAAAKIMVVRYLTSPRQLLRSHPFPSLRLRLRDSSHVSTIKSGHLSLFVLAVETRIQGLELPLLLPLPPHVHLPTQPNEQREMRDPAPTPSERKRPSSPRFKQPHSLTHSLIHPPLPHHNRKKKDSTQVKSPELTT